MPGLWVGPFPLEAFGFVSHNSRYICANNYCNRICLPSQSGAREGRLQLNNGARISRTDAHNKRRHTVTFRFSLIHQVPNFAGEAKVQPSASLVADPLAYPLGSQPGGAFSSKVRRAVPNPVSIRRRDSAVGNAPVARACRLHRRRSSLSPN